MGLYTAKATTVWGKLVLKKQIEVLLAEALRALVEFVSANPTGPESRGIRWFVEVDPQDLF